MAAGICTGAVQGVGDKICIAGNPLRMIAHVILATPQQVFATYADFQSESVWNAGIADGSLLPLVKVLGLEDASTEAVVNETPSGDKKKTRDGKRGMVLEMDMSLAQNKVFQTYVNGNFSIYFIDEANNIIGTSSDGTSVKGLSLSFFDPKPVTIPTGADINATTKLEIQLDNWEEIDINGITALGTDLQATSFIPKKLVPVTRTAITDVSIATNDITFSVSYTDTTIASLSSNPQINLVAADLVFVDQTGAVVAADSITESATVPGTYVADMTAAGMTSGTVQQVATVDNLFSSPTAAVTA